MSDGDNSLKQLLTAAEAEIMNLFEKNTAQAQQIDQLIEAQELQGEEVIELADKVWELTEILQHTRDQSAEAQMIAGVLSEKLSALRTQMNGVLNAAKENASRIQLVTNIYEMTDERELTEEEEIMAEYSRRMTELRERLTKA